MAETEGSGRVDVRLFGAFSATVDGRVVHIRTRPAQSVLGRVCVAGSRLLTRIQIASDVWPDEPFAVSGNRLRTCLVMLKRALSPVDGLKGDRSNIWVDEECLHSDFSLATALLKKVRVLPDLDEEQEALQDLLKLIDLPLLADFDDLWIEPYRTAWIQERTRSWLRLAQIHQESGQLLDALAAAEKSLEFDEFNSEAWIRRLRLSASLGQTERALQRYEAARAALMRGHGAEFPTEVGSVASRIKRGSVTVAKPHHEFSPAQEKLLVDTLGHMAVHDLEGFHRFLGSPSFRAQVFRKSVTAFELVLDALELGESSPDVRLGLVRSGLVASVSLDEHDEMDKLCEWLIENCPEDTADHVIGLQHLSFTRFVRREWEAAYAYSARALELARKYQPSQTPFILAGNAALDWHMGRLDEAERAYKEAIDYYSDESELKNRYNLAVIAGNLGYLKTAALDWEAASAYALDAWRRTAADSLEPLRASTGLLLGFTRVVLGSPDGVKLIVDGLTGSYRSRSLRFVEIGMDYAAGALACLGEGANALATLEAAARFRARRRHFRSPAEEILATWVRDRAGKQAAVPSWPESEPLLDAILRLCTILEGCAI